jgi:hypothetical protein
VLVVPGLGGRVISLRDRRCGREWLMQGPPPSPELAADWTSESVVFSGPESFGWDECLPTVAPCPDALDPEAPPLRDHGDQWGRRAAAFLDSETGELATAWAGPRWGYDLSRRLSLEDEVTVLARYHLHNPTAGALPILWSQHPVLRLEPGSYLDLPEVHSAVCTSAIGIELAEEVAWPRASLPDGGEVDLACVKIATGWAAKLYAHAPEPIRAVTLDGASLELDWDRSFAPVLGVWLSYGGWPPGAEPYEQVALEPTTSTDDHLAGALTHERQAIVEAGDTREWWVRMRLSC